MNLISSKGTGKTTDRKLLRSKKELAGFFGVLGIGLILFKWIIYYELNTDMYEHVDLVLFYVERGSFPPVPLYYFTIYALSLFSKTPAVIYNAVIVVLGASLAFKYLCALKVLKFIKGPEAFLSPENNLVKTRSTGPEVILIITTLFLAPVFINAKYSYIGKLGIDIWHNSTTIFLMAFALLLFLQSYKFLITGKLKFLYQVLGLCLINLLIKPSYYFAFAPVFTLFALAVFFRDRNYLKAKVIGVMAVSGILLAGIYYAIYFDSIWDEFYYNQKSAVVIAPFAVWKVYSDNLLLDSFVSIAYPLAFFICYFQKLKRNLLFLYTVAIFVFSVLVFIFLAEAGPRFDHANFLWQAIISNYMLFLVCLSLQIKFNYQGEWFKKRNILLFTLYFIHFISGVMYLSKILFRDYYF